MPRRTRQDRIRAELAQEVSTRVDTSPRVATLAGEEERLRHRIEHLRGLIDGLVMLLDDPAPPGPNAAQQVANAALDVAVYTGRVDLARRHDALGGSR